MSEELKPCPFCGCNEIIGNQYINRDMQDCYAIYCSNCDATIRGYTESETIAAWNTRHEPDELPEWFVDAIKNRINWWVNHIVMKAPELREGIADGAGHIDALKWVLSLRKPEVKE